MIVNSWKESYDHWRWFWPAARSISTPCFSLVSKRRRQYVWSSREWTWPLLRTSSSSSTLLASFKLPPIMPRLCSWWNLIKILVFIHDIQAASLLQMDSLLGRCTDFIVEELDLDNCLEILEFANQIGYEKLRLEAENFAGKYFREVYFKCNLEL